MKIVNNKIVPPYNPELIKAALLFLNRVDLKGQEARTHTMVCDLLGAIAEGHYVVSDAPIDKPGKASRQKMSEDGPPAAG